MITRLIYIGDHFYHESGSIMSPVYTEDGRRYDWGFVQRDLAEGKSISIRPATPEEKTYYEQKLQQLRKERGQE